MKNLFLIIYLFSSLAYADTPLLLPTENNVKETLLNSPEIQQARAKKQSLEFHAQAIEAGNAEFTLHTSRQHRSVTGTSERYLESSVGIERPIRMWGKRELDQKLSQQTNSLAAIEYADAIHEASRELLKHWFSYLRAQSMQINADETLTIAQNNERLANIRLKHGEISQLDANLAHAEFLRAQANWQTSQANMLSQKTRITRRYPGLDLPQEPSVRLQEIPFVLISNNGLREDFLATNHELIYLKNEAQRLQYLAQRIDKERYSDPTLGIFSTRERDSAEQITGLSLSFAFPGAARQHLAQAAFADAQAAQDKVADSERVLGAEFDALLMQFQLKRTAAAQLKLSASEQTQAAEKSKIAYSLGENSMSEMLQAERLASDQRLSADLMHLEVLELQVSIQLDLHQIYDFD